MTTPLLPCPFCGCQPVWGLTKKTGCQMHGEPIQYVTLYCGKIGCPAKPAVKGGDRYSSGFESGERFKECEKEARNAAATEWNTRTPTPLEKSHRELYEALKKLKAEYQWNIGSILDAADRAIKNAGRLKGSFQTKYRRMQTYDPRTML